MEKNGEITDKTPSDQRTGEKRAGADDKDHAKDRAADAVQSQSKKQK